MVSPRTELITLIEPVLATLASNIIEAHDNAADRDYRAKNAIM